MRKGIPLLWLVALITLLAVYLIWGRSLAQAAVEGTAPEWFRGLVRIFYPRLAVEKHRFEASFFLRKADQVVLRFALVNLVLLVGLYLYRQKSGFREYLHHFWNRPVPAERIPALRVLFFAFLIFFSYEWYRDLIALHRAVAFYKPLPLLRLLHLDFPAPWLLAVLCGLLLLSCVTALFNLKPVLSSAVAAALFVLLQAFLFSFEKMDHTFALLTYAAMLMPFLLAEHRKVIRAGKTFLNGWPLWLTGLVTGIVYLQTGLEKLLIGGPEWLSPETFRNYVYLHQAPLGLWAARSAFLSAMLPLLALVFELGFIAIVFRPKLAWVFLPAGVLFHAGTYLLLGVGWYFNGWIATYIFFIPWERMGGKCWILNFKF